MRRWFSILGLAAGLACGLPGTSSAQEPIHWSLAVTTKGPLKAGQNVEAALTARIDKGWHLYALDEPAGGPLPTVITVPPQKPFGAAGAATAPAGTKASTELHLETEYFRRSHVHDSAETGGRHGQRPPQAEDRHQLADVQRPALPAAERNGADARRRCRRGVTDAASATSTTNGPRPIDSGLTASTPAISAQQRNGFRRSGVAAAAAPRVVDMAATERRRSRHTSVSRR